MKNSAKKGLHFQPGAGHLIGSVFTIVSAILIFLLSENIVVALSASIPIGFTIGLLAEQRLQPDDGQPKRDLKRAVNVLLVVGLLLLVIILIFHKFM